MSPATLLASLSNLAGPDLFLLPVLLFGAVIVGISVLVLRLRRRDSKPSARLQRLDTLLKAGAISESEYQDQRRRILSEI